MNFYYRIEEKTILPLMLLAGGGMNHLMVLVSRYIFMPNDKYGNELQIRIAVPDRYHRDLPDVCPGGKVRILQEKATLAMPVKTVSIALAAMFLIGNVMTTTEEFRFGKYRKEHNRDEVKQILLNFENESDNTLEDALEYHKPGCRSALTILKRKRLEYMEVDL